ncbi:MAG: HD domain-containing phosphohydrolase [Planctomycetota bacterium]
MQAAPLPENEEDRLRALHDCELLDTCAERGFDEIVRMATLVFGVPIALVSLVDEQRQWFKSSVGLDGCESGRDQAFCSHAILRPDEVTVVTDARRDPRFRDNPFVTAPPHIRFYAGAPLVDPNGHALGTLCLISPEPGDLDAGQRESLALLARQVVDQIAYRNAARRSAAYQRELEDHKTNLEIKVRLRTRELHRSRQEVIQALARAAEFRDDDTGHHVRRVSLYVREICLELGYDADGADRVALASKLHDVGKIGVPDSILLKPGKLTQEQFEVMKKHSDHGCTIVAHLDEDEEGVLQGHCGLGPAILGNPEYPLLQIAARIALSHHERWDGTGYPKQLAGDDIPIEGRITAVADVFDALTSARPYKPAFTFERACEILIEGRGSHFDPAALDAFFARIDAVQNIYREYRDALALTAEDAA